MAGPAAADAQSPVDAKAPAVTAGCTPELRLVSIADAVCLQSNHGSVKQTSMIIATRAQVEQLKPYTQGQAGVCCIMMQACKRVCELRCAPLCRQHAHELRPSKDRGFRAEAFAAPRRCELPATSIGRAHVSVGEAVRHRRCPRGDM